MKKILKLLSSYIERFYAIAFIICIGIVLFDFRLVYLCVYNFFSIIAIGCAIYCNLRLFSWKFGDNPFIKGDILASKYKKENRQKEFKAMCLENATVAFAVAVIFFIFSIVFHFVRLVII